MKNKKLLIGLVATALIGILLIVGTAIYAFYSLSPVVETTDVVTFEIEYGTSETEVLEKLKDANIIRSDLFAKIYLRLNNDLEIQAGTFNLDRSTGTVAILKELTDSNAETITLRFEEGLRVTHYAELISEKFDYTEKEVLNLLESTDFAKEMIEKYEMLTDDILNDEIYYPLEGYLFPNTYEFYKDSTLEEVIEVLVAESNKQFKLLEEDIISSGYSLHELLTVASITEKEANTKEDREEVATVVYNRLDLDMTLGMDVTTYYGVQKEQKLSLEDDDNELTEADLNALNGYNTRNASFFGLPVGPICNSSLESVLAAINPVNSNSIYFCADDEGDVHFQEDYNDFLNVCR